METVVFHIAWQVYIITHYGQMVIFRTYSSISALTSKINEKTGKLYKYIIFAFHGFAIPRVIADN